MDILTRLHNLPPSRFHYKLLVLVGIGWLFDAMDTGLVSFVLPALGKDWALAPAQLGWIVSIAFVGMALGAVFSGWLADRFGRKPFLPVRWWCTALPQVCARLRLI